MSGLGSFFGEGDSYETSLVDVVDLKEPPDTTVDGGSTSSHPEQAKDTDQREAYEVALKTKTLEFLKLRIYDYDSHPAVPHISKALLDANEISELSLNVKQLNLSLCQMQKLWPLRLCKRDRSYCPGADRSTLQRDGPISILYKTVFSFEILQCFIKPPSELSQRIRNLHGEGHLHHGCRVFLYNAYAQKMTEFLNGVRDGNQVYCSLRHVPAQCIHRYEATDWADAKEKYCLTIGDDSKVTQGDCRTRFDSEDLIVEIIRVGKSEKVLSEYQLRRLDTGDVVLEEVEDSRLSSIYKAYKAKEYATPAPSAPKRAPVGADTPTDQVGGEATSGDQPVGPRCVKLVSIDLATTRASDQWYPQQGDLPALHDTSDLLKAEGGAVPRQKVDVFALALSFTQPYRTRRGDLTMSITIIDDSLPVPPDSDDSTSDTFIKTHSVIIFVGSKMGHLLPKLRTSGDALFMQDLEMNMFNGEIQLIGHKRVDSSYTCYRQESSSSGSSPTTVVDPDRLTEGEKNRLKELWLWGQKRLRLHATMKQEHRFRISDVLSQQSTQTDSFGSIAAANQGDMFAMITAIIPWEESNTPPPHPKGFLRVWDGTGESISDMLPLQSMAALQAVNGGDPPEEIVVGIAGLVEKIRSYNADSDLKPPGALAGRVVNVAIWETQHWKLVDDGHLKVGLFIRIRNVVESIMPRLGVRCLNVQSKSSFTITPSMTFEVIKLIEEHNERLLNGEATNPSSAVLPLDMEEGVQVSTIIGRPQATPQKKTLQRLLKGTSLQIELLHKFAAAPHGALFFGIVQLTAIFPPIQQAIDDSIEKTYCREEPGPSRKPYFQFALRLEQEGSATVIEAIVCDKGKRKPIGPLVFSSSAEAAIGNPATVLDKLQEALVPTKRWKALINSTIVDGKKFFLLTSLSPYNKP